MAKPGPKPRRKELPKWTPEFAYAVGLLVSDGNLSKDGRHLEFTSIENEQIDNLKRCLGLKVKTAYKQNGQGGWSYHVQWGDVILYRWLNSIGLMSNKSKVIGRLDIPDSIFFHFLRGYYDGDGSCYSFWDARWKNSFLFYLRFISGSKEYLDWLQAALRRKLSVTGHIYREPCSWVLSFAKSDTKKIVAEMYPAKNVPHLSRKLSELKQVIAIDKERAVGLQ